MIPVMTLLGRRALWLGAAMLALVCLLVLAQESTPPADEQTQASALVTRATLHQGPMSTTVAGYGAVAALPGKARNLTLPQAGLVTEVKVIAGDTVKRGATLLTLNTDPAGRMAFQQAETGLDLARTDLDRTRQLRAQSLATESQLAAAEKAFSDAATALETQRELGTATANSDLKAPFDGIVLDVPVALGDRTAAGAVLARAIAQGSMQVVAGLSPHEARRVKPGMTAAIETAGADGATTEAKVTHVQAMVNPVSRLVDAVLEPTQPSGSPAWLPATAVRAVITVSTDTFWLAPRAAVLRDERGAYMFEIVDGHAKRVDVRTPGAANEQEIAVEGSFAPNAEVAVLGAYELEDGMAVHDARAPAP